MAILSESFIKLFTIIIGIIILLAGISQLVIIFSHRPLNIASKIFIIIPILISISSIFMIFYPLKSAKILTIIFFGITLSIYGIMNIILGIWIKSLKNNNKNLIVEDTKIIE